MHHLLRTNSIKQLLYLYVTLHSHREKLWDHNKVLKSERGYLRPHIDAVSYFLTHTHTHPPPHTPPHTPHTPTHTPHTHTPPHTPSPPPTPHTHTHTPTILGLFFFLFNWNRINVLFIIYSMTSYRLLGAQTCWVHTAYHWQNSITAKKK